jgi:hypothetical protein
MAFPVDAARIGTGGSTAATNKVCNLPTGISSGDLLLLILRSAGADTHSTPTGWTALALNNGADAADDITSVFYRVASGTEGSTVTVNGTASLKFAAICWRITGGDTPQISTAATGTSTTPDPPSFTPSGGAKDYLWIWLGAWEGEQTSPPSGSPTNYNNPVGANSGTAGAITTNCQVAGASRQLNAASEDPPSWTISASDDWTAWTVAIPPALAVFTPAFDAFRFYNDGSESGSSPWAAQSTNISVRCGAGDRKVHLRVRIQETGGAAGASTDDWQLQYSKNGGAYTNVTASSSNVRADTGSSLTDGSATTNRATNGITDGTGSFVAGVQEEGDGQIADHQLTASNFTEHVFALMLVAADLANGDTLDFRISLNGGSPGMTNSVTPRITVNKGTPSALKFKSGSYTGEGDASQTVTGLGFSPKLIFIQGVGATKTFIRTSAMATDSARSFDNGTSSSTGYITSLDADGFTVGANLNAAATTYHWAAFGGDVNEIVSFSYTGTGVDGQFLDCGFTPDAVFILKDDAGDDVRWGTSDTAADTTLLADQAAESNQIQAYEVGGVQLGSGAQVNSSGATYYLLALKDRPGALKTHTYTGNAADDRSITGAGFQPQFALVKGLLGWPGHIRYKDQTGDNSFPLNSVDQFANRIQAFGSDGMTIGTDAGVNADLDSFYVLWAREEIVASLVPNLRRSHRAMLIR